MHRMQLKIVHLRLVLLLAAGASLHVQGASPGPIPENLVLLLPGDPVTVGSDWAIGLNATETPREQLFRATQFFIASSNGTDMQNRNGQHDAFGTANLGNSRLGKAWDSATGDFIALPDNEPVCITQGLERGLTATFNPGTQSWPADKYDITVRIMVWTGAKGVEETELDGDKTWCITPPFSNYSVKGVAAVTVVPATQQDANKALETSTTTLAFATGIDAYGQTQPTPPSNHDSGASRLARGSGGVLAGMLSFLAAWTFAAA